MMIGKPSPNAESFLRYLCADIRTDKALGTPASVHAPSASSFGMSPSLCKTQKPYNFANTFIANTSATVAGPSNPNGRRSEAPNQRATTTETENAWDQAENEDEDDDEDFGLPEGFEGLNLDDEDEFDRSWSA